MSTVTLTTDEALRTYPAQEFCERAGISRRTLDKLLARGEVTAVPHTRGAGKNLKLSALELAKFIYGDAVVGGGRRG